LRILGVDAYLDGVAVQAHVLLPERQRLARRDAQLQLHQVEAGDEFGDGMFHLQARVHLHEEELVRTVRGDDELHGAGAHVPDAARRLACGGPDAGTRRGIQQGEGASSTTF
jgi:hypothetical protein